MANARFTVDDRALRVALNKSVKGLQTDTREAFNEAGADVVKNARRWIEKWKKVDTGAYRDSLFAEVTERRGKMTLTVGPPERLDILGSTLEFGRKPGSRMPPQGALLPWMARHGIEDSAEFVIRRAIARNGMRGQPFPHIGPSVDDSLPAFDAAFSRVLDRLEANFYGG